MLNQIRHLHDGVLFSKVVVLLHILSWKTYSARVCLEVYKVLQDRSLWENCPYSEFFWSVFSHNRTQYWELLRSQSECGKILTRKTLNTDTFHSVDMWRMRVNGYSRSQYRSLKLSFSEKCLLGRVVKWVKVPHSKLDSQSQSHGVLSWNLVPSFITKVPVTLRPIKDTWIINMGEWGRAPENSPKLTVGNPNRW